MVGTFGGALEARQIDASNGRLTADVRGEIESDDGTLVLRRIHVALRLKGAGDRAEVVERVHGVFAAKCPVYRSLQRAITVTSSYERVD
jgi:uncharacterized OsmC-like protein